jgi:hypothetical protein
MMFLKHFTRRLHATLADSSLSAKTNKQTNIINTKLHASLYVDAESMYTLTAKLLR